MQMKQDVQILVPENPASFGEVLSIALRRLQQLAARLKPETFYAFVSEKVTVYLHSPLFFGMHFSAAYSPTTLLFTEHPHPFFCSSTHAPGNLHSWQI